MSLLTSIPNILVSGVYLLSTPLLIGCGDDRDAGCGDHARELLLEVRDTLAGTGSLNWSPDLPTSDWQGVEFSDGLVFGDGPALNGCVTEIQLGNVGLTGAIPPEVAQLGSLETLNLGGNELTGEIPPELSKLESLKTLRLGHNDLTGEIPTELARLGSLEEIHLQHNNLTGPIPHELGTLPSVLYLMLGDNELTGEIPPQLGELTPPVVLSLSDNRLTGEIPAELVRLNDSDPGAIIDVRNNELDGCLPRHRASVTFLVTPQRGGRDIPLCPTGR